MSYKQMTIEHAKSAIGHGCDGPITPFVLISRATEIVSKGCDPVIAANALYEYLVAYEYLTDETVFETGS
jgi:hypothetical protein